MIFLSFLDQISLNYTPCDRASRVLQFDIKIYGLDIFVGINISQYCCASILMKYPVSLDFIIFNIYVIQTKFRYVSYRGLKSDTLDLNKETNLNVVMNNYRKLQGFSNILY